MNGVFRRRRARRDPVVALQEATRAAQALASVPRTELLADPRLNPATRAQADRLQAERLAMRLDLEHKRVLRSEREADRAAEEAVRAAEAVSAARAATDPARTVLDITRARTRFTAASLGASLLLSVGSAMGLEAAVARHYPTAPAGIGYLAEIALTGMSTAAILWAGLLARADALPTGKGRWLLGGLVAVPLAASAVGSTIGSGPVGAIASIGSALFSLFALLVATTSASAVGGLLGRLGAPVAGTGGRDRDDTDEEGEDGDGGTGVAAEAAAYLARRAEAGDDGGGDDGATCTLPPGPEGEDDAPAEGGTVLLSPPPGRGDGTPPEGLEGAVRRRSAAARERVRAYYAAHPGAPVKRAAADLGVDPKTVRKYRPVDGKEDAE